MMITFSANSKKVVEDFYKIGIALGAKDEGAPGPRHGRDYYAYIRDATKFNDPQLNTHSDDFSSALGHGGGYRHVYYKTAAMLYNLEYVLGEELFLKAMQHYFHKWKMAHPYFDDFREAIVEYTKVDLNWFFDQWMETTKSGSPLMGLGCFSLQRMAKKPSITLPKKIALCQPTLYRI
mgnify:CR=1 FL=1